MTHPTEAMIEAALDFMIDAPLDIPPRLYAIAIYRAMEAAAWSADMSAAPMDGNLVMIYVAQYDDLPGFVTATGYHPDAGWCVDALSETTHWRPLPEPPEDGA